METVGQRVALRSVHGNSNTWKLSKSGGGGGWRRSVDRSVKSEVLSTVKKERRVIVIRR